MIKPEDGKETQFKPGESGNPEGRPKGVRNTKTILQEFFDSEVEFDDIEGKPQKMRMVDAMHLKQIKKAIKDGDTAAYKAIMERYEGMPNQKVQNEHSFQKMPTIKKNGKPARFNVGTPLQPSEN